MCGLALPESSRLKDLSGPSLSFEFVLGVPCVGLQRSIDGGQKALANTFFWCRFRIRTPGPPTVLVDELAMPLRWFAIDRHGLFLPGDSNSA
jgi:hypothetical protein